MLMFISPFIFFIYFFISTVMEKAILCIVKLHTDTLVQCCVYFYCEQQIAVEDKEGVEYAFPGAQRLNMMCLNYSDGMQIGV